MTLPSPYNNFTGGLNTQAQPFLLEDNQARDLQNVQASQAGAIMKRPGLQTFATPASALSSLYAFEDGPAPFLIGAGGTSLYKIAADGTVGTIKTGLASGGRWEFAQITASGGSGPLFGMNGQDTPQEWDGAAGTTSNWVATTGTVPNGKYMTQFGNRVWVAGVAAHPSRLYFSDLAINSGAMNWPAANQVDFDPDDGMQITGIGHVGPYLLVGKQRKLFIVYDQDTGANRRISDSVGIASHRSIAESPSGTFFLAEDRGVYETNGSTVQPVSDVIQPTIDTIVAGKRPLSAGVYFNGHYYLSVCRSGTVNDTILDYDTLLGSWWLHTFGSSQWAVWHPSTSAELFSAKSTAAIVDQAFVPDVLVDNGSPFTWRWRGPWQSPSYFRRRLFPSPYYRKRLRQLRVIGAGTVDVSLATDFSLGEVLKCADAFRGNDGTDNLFGGTGIFGGAGIFGGHPFITQKKLYTLGVANAFSVVFSATSDTKDEITEYALMIQDRRDMMPT